MALEQTESAFEYCFRAGKVSVCKNRSANAAMSRPTWMERFYGAAIFKVFKQSGGHASTDAERPDHFFHAQSTLETIGDGGAESAGEGGHVEAPGMEFAGSRKSDPYFRLESGGAGANHISSSFLKFLSPGQSRRNDRRRRVNNRFRMGIVKIQRMAQSTVQKSSVGRGHPSFLTYSAARA